MGIVIGPVLRRADGYRFDTWTAGKGMTRGYPYRRIEDAHYARNAEIKASAQGRALAAIASLSPKSCSFISNAGVEFIYSRLSDFYRYPRSMW
jgi:hypothetical protein